MHSFKNYCHSSNEAHNEAAEPDYSHLLQAPLVHQPLPSATKWWQHVWIYCCTTCRRGLLCDHTHPFSFGASSTFVPSVTLNDRREHIFLSEKNYFKRSRVTYRDRARLTFSPDKPLSPTVPGSVWPGRPCVNHSQISTHQSFLSRLVKYTESLY